MLDQAIHGLPGRWATIDVVSQKNRHWPDDRMPRNIGFDKREQGIQQVQPAMDVANCINPHPIGQGGLAPVGLASDILQWNSHSPSLTPFAAKAAANKAVTLLRPVPDSKEHMLLRCKKNEILSEWKSRAYYQAKYPDAKGI